jgi:proline dehydrogenase
MHENDSFLSKFNVGSMLNYGVELKETEEDFEKTILQTLESIGFAGKNKQVKSICIKLTGFGRFDLFEKMDRKEVLSKNEEIELQSVKKRLDRLCVAAKENDVVLYVDAEESWIQDALDGLVEEMMEKYNLQKPVIFNTIQLYRNDRLAFLERSIQLQKVKAIIMV